MMLLYSAVNIQYILKKQFFSFCSVIIHRRALHEYFITAGLKELWPCRLNEAPEGLWQWIRMFLYLRTTEGLRHRRR